MRDAMGGSVTIVLVVFFIVVALGYMAFNVNYTKAFRMKDKIVSLYNDYNGDCIQNTNCQNEIKKYAEQIGYQGYDFESCPTDFTLSPSGLYCWKESHGISSSLEETDVNQNEDGIVNPKANYYSYTIVTRINVQLPIVNKFLSFRFLDISGDTKTYHRK